MEDSLQSVCQLKLLRHLDVSQCNNFWGHWKDPTGFLSSLATSLPCLESLDISGTNLASSGSDSCGVPGLSSRYPLRGMS